jgi:hypothetical protein
MSEVFEPNAVAGGSENPEPVQGQFGPRSGGSAHLCCATYCTGAPPIRLPNIELRFPVARRRYVATKRQPCTSILIRSRPPQLALSSRIKHDHGSDQLRKLVRVGVDFPVVNVSLSLSDEDPFVYFSYTHNPGVLRPTTNGQARSLKNCPPVSDGTRSQRLLYRLRE